MILTKDNLGEEIGMRVKDVILYLLRTETPVESKTKNLIFVGASTSKHLFFDFQIKEF